MIEHNPGFKVSHGENVVPIYVDTIEQAKIVESCFIVFTSFIKYDSSSQYFDFEFTSDYSKLERVNCREGNVEDFKDHKMDTSRVPLVYTSKMIKGQIEDFLESVYVDVEKLKDAKECLFGCNDIVNNLISVQISAEIERLDNLMSLAQKVQTYLV